MAFPIDMDSSYEELASMNDVARPDPRRSRKRAVAAAALDDTNVSEMTEVIGTLLIRRKNLGPNNALLWVTVLLWLCSMGYMIMGIVAILADVDINVETLTLVTTIIGIVLLGIIATVTVVVYRYEYYDLAYDHGVSVTMPWVVGFLGILIPYIGLVSTDKAYPDKDDFVEWQRYTFIMILFVFQGILMCMVTGRAIAAHRAPIAQSAYAMKMDLTPVGSMM